MILVPLLNPKFATSFAAKTVRTSGSRHEEIQANNMDGLRFKAPGAPPVMLSRRTLLRLAAAAAPLSAVCRTGRAQAYPSRPVRIVVGQSAGSGTDTAARLLAQ